MSLTRHQTLQCDLKHALQWTYKRETEMSPSQTSHSTIWSKSDMLRNWSRTVEFQNLFRCYYKIYFVVSFHTKLYLQHVTCNMCHKLSVECVWKIQHRTSLISSKLLCQDHFFNKLKISSEVTIALSWWQEFRSRFTGGWGISETSA